MSIEIQLTKLTKPGWILGHLGHFFGGTATTTPAPLLQARLLWSLREQMLPCWGGSTLVQKYAKDVSHEFRTFVTELFFCIRIAKKAPSGRLMQVYALDYFEVCPCVRLFPALDSATQIGVWCDRCVILGECRGGWTITVFTRGFHFDHNISNKKQHNQPAWHVITRFSF